MREAVTFTNDTAVKPWARRLRMTLQLTQQELADMCGVSQEEVDLFESNLPVRLDAKRRISKELWAAKNYLATANLFEK